ncbi:MAG: DUF2283 domain-containing protein [Candidatus Falkowbacteria bacterium]|nr:DUF2283 domain-containing protein [Candidatus Falkowbacteria bacterium]
MHYDIEANIISWEIGQGKISHVKEFGNFIVHLSKAGKPILIEILNASKFKNKLSRVETIKLINEAIS